MMGNVKEKEKNHRKLTEARSAPKPAEAYLHASPSCQDAVIGALPEAGSYEAKGANIPKRQHAAAIFPCQRLTTILRTPFFAIIHLTEKTRSIMKKLQFT